jgi:hypothetical protein
LIDALSETRKVKGIEGTKCEPSTLIQIFRVVLCSVSFAQRAHRLLFLVDAAVAALQDFETAAAASVVAASSTTTPLSLQEQIQAAAST